MNSKSDVNSQESLERLIDENSFLRSALEKTDQGKELIQQREEFSLLLAGSKLIVSELNLDTVFQLVASKARDIVEADLVLVPMLNERRDRYTYRAAAGVGAEAVFEASFPVTVGMCGWVLRNERSLLFGEGSLCWLDEMTTWEKDQQSAVLVPLFGRKQIIGGLSALGKKGGGSFTPHDLDLLTMFANQVSTAIENAALFHELESEVEERRRLTLRNEMILNSAGEGIYGTDIDGNIVFMNHAAQGILGFAMPDVIGENSHRMFHHTKADGRPYPFEECPLHKSLTDGESYHGLEEVFWTRDGRMFPVEHVNTPLVDHGVVVGAVVVFRDISERKRTEEEIRGLNEGLEKRVAERTADLQNKSEELKDSQTALMNMVEDLNEKTSELEQANSKLHELDRLKSMFIASMSHELRTPLNSIIGFSSILLNEWVGPLTAEQKENLAAVLRAGKHLLSLINDVIDVSKIEAGKIESIVEDFEVRDLVMEAVETLQKDIESKGLELKVHTPRLVMHADRRRLLQCLLNLVSNAVKYTNQGSIIVSVEISTDGSTMTMGVEDTGIGIREDELGRLFSPFVRLNPPLGSAVPGTGLGLYLTKKLVREILKGDLSVASTYGAGSRFTLRVPVTG